MTSRGTQSIETKRIESYSPSFKIYHVVPFVIEELLQPKTALSDILASELMYLLDEDERVCAPHRPVCMPQNALFTIVTSLGSIVGKTNVK